MNLIKPTRCGPRLQSMSYTQLVNAVTEDRSSGQCVFSYVISSHQRDQNSSWIVSWHPYATSSGENLSWIRQVPYNCRHSACFQVWGAQAALILCAPSLPRRPPDIPAGLQSIVTEDSWATHFIRKLFS